MKLLVFTSMLFLYSVQVWADPVKLSFSDGKSMDVDSEVLKSSGTIKNCLEDLEQRPEFQSKRELPVPSISRDDFEAVLPLLEEIERVRKAREESEPANSTENVIKLNPAQFETAYLKGNRSFSDSAKLIINLNYLDVPGALPSAKEYVAGLIRNFTDLERWVEETRGIQIPREVHPLSFYVDDLLVNYWVTKKVKVDLKLDTSFDLGPMKNPLLAVHPTQNHVAIVSGDGRLLYFRNVLREDRAVEISLDFLGRSREVKWFSFNDWGTYLILGFRDSVVLYSVANLNAGQDAVQGMEYLTYAPIGDVLGADVSPDGNRLVACFTNGQCASWNVQDGNTGAGGNRPVIVDITRYKIPEEWQFHPQFVDNRLVQVFSPGQFAYVTFKAGESTAIFRSKEPPDWKLGYLAEYLPRDKKFQVGLIEKISSRSKASILVNSKSNPQKTRQVFRLIGPSLRRKTHYSAMKVSFDDERVPVASRFRVNTFTGFSLTQAQDASKGWLGWLRSNRAENSRQEIQRNPSYVLKIWKHPFRKPPTPEQFFIFKAMWNANDFWLGLLKGYPNLQRIWAEADPLVQ